MRSSAETVRSFLRHRSCFFPPQILVLENVRFYKEETKNDPGFAQKVSYFFVWLAASPLVHVWQRDIERDH